MLGFACLLLACAFTLDYVDAARQHIPGSTPPEQLFFGFDHAPRWAFWLGIGLFTINIVLCALDQLACPRTVLPLRTAGLRLGLLSVLCAALPPSTLAVSIALAVNLLAEGLARVFP